MPELHALSAGELIRRYRRRELSPVEVARDALARIDRLNPIVNAFVLVDREAALAAAAAAEARWKQGAPVGLVDGVPTTIKDNVWAKGWPSRRGSRTSDPAPIAADAPAVASAAARSTSTNALTIGFNRSMRASASRATSTGESSRRR